MDEIAHGLHTPPARRGISEQVPSRLAQLVGLAIAAAHEKQQAVVRQVRDGDFTRREVRRVDLPIVFDRRVASDGEITGRRDQSAASIAKRFEIGGGWDDRGREDLLGDGYVGLPIFAHRQQANERSRLRGIDRDFITDNGSAWVAAPKASLETR
jgi:hypothetical protein